MGDQGLLQELPAISPLLREAGGDREQSDAEDRTLGRLKAMADLALNHRMAQGSICSIVGGSMPFISRKVHRPSATKSNCRQVPTVLVHGVRSPRWEPSSTTRCSVPINAWRIGWQP